jgi:hypothetical protein
MVHPSCFGVTVSQLIIAVFVQPYSNKEEMPPADNSSEFLDSRINELQSRSSFANSQPSLSYKHYIKTAVAVSMRYQVSCHTDLVVWFVTEMILRHRWEA